jgi:hypothetical protein
VRDGLFGWHAVGDFGNSTSGVVGSMPGLDVPRERSLGPGDPRVLGTYQILGRIGEGGMGRVYLAAAADGRNVALKVVRADLAHDPEFRRRFRGEVARARQVPPFCTAEVLDADTEHDPPYLVVEYVDGPSLASVVKDRGPLTPANQHGLAVGMAVALSAIHGAGVIHRDLKPSNVLLAPGSPKVIDFGIARAVAATEVATRTDQVVGTVAYMAPERFGPDASSTLTPAADIFSWGAVVTYAATGQTPFGADIPAAVAVRIMTQPPDLDGLTGPLRELVEYALAKAPGDRPTARELIDHLLAGSAPARPAAFARQPEVLAAAGITPVVPRFHPGGGTAVIPSSHEPRTAVVATQMVPRPHMPTYPDAAMTAVIERPRRRRRGVTLLVTTAVVALLAAAGIGAYAAGLIHLPNTALASNPPGQSSAPNQPVGSTPPQTPAETLLIEDPLTAPRVWQNTAMATFGASCALGDGLTVTLGDAKAGAYKCKGLDDPLADFRVAVDVTLQNADSCAGIWFHYVNPAGYALKICQDRWQVYAHVDRTLRLIQSFYGPDPFTVGAPIRVGVQVSGGTMTFTQGSKVVGTLNDNRFGPGKVVLGVFPMDGAPAPYVVTFQNIQVYKPVSG